MLSEWADRQDGCCLLTANKWLLDLPQSHKSPEPEKDLCAALESLSSSALNGVLAADEDWTIDDSLFRKRIGSGNQEEGSQEVVFCDDFTLLEQFARNDIEGIIGKTVQLLWDGKIANGNENALHSIALIQKCGS